MKRIICCLLTGTLCVLTLGGFGNQNVNDPTTATDNSEQSVDVLKEMEAVNETDALQLRYGKVAYSHIDYNLDGTVEKNYYYKDQERHVHLEDPDYVKIDESGEVYGLDDEGNAFRYLFVGDYYEEYYGSRQYLHGYQYDGEDETVLKQVTEDGIIHIETEITNEDIVNEYVEHYGYEEDNVPKILTCYEIEEETYVISKYTTTAVLEDGTQMLLTETVRVEDVDTYVPDEQLTKAVFEGDLQTLIVTVDAGTDSEKVYTQTISKGNHIRIRLPKSYDQTKYLDAEYTMEYDGDYALESDLHIYVRSKE